MPGPSRRGRQSSAQAARPYATRAERRRAETSTDRAENPPIGMGGSTFWFSVLLTVVGALVPGAALFAAGRRRVGGVLLVLTLIGLFGLVWLALAGQRAVLYVAVNPRALLLIGLALPVVALVWAVVVVTGWTSVRPLRTSSLQRAISATVVSLLCLAVVVPTVVASRYALVQRDLVTSVFAAKDQRSATTPDDVTADDPWAGQARLNVLLLGGDGGRGRDGVRTDTVILASIDTRSGDTTLFSLPRNLENLPFPPGPLREVYPDGFTAPGNAGETLLNAIYRNVPSQYPDVLGPTDDLGADVLKLGVGEALGLNVDYYMLVNLEGFKQLVDALGGVTVDINTWVPIGGVTDLGQLPDDYLSPGADQSLNGFQALWFARGRFGSSDYERMDRQRCVINAVIEQADPVTLLSRYQSLAATAQDILSTDIPQTLLPAFVDLGLRIKDGAVTSVVFDTDVISPAYPDYDFIRATVAKALAPPPSPPATSSTAPSATAPPTSAAPSLEPTDPAATGTPPAAESLENSCAYDALTAQAALADGEPPTRRN
ncbi:MAG: LCP family protein [Geodermatophilaceae bacterium]|nr:LCP family protein [Geodermatophilaceae bacterium]